MSVLVSDIKNISTSSFIRFISWTVHVNFATVYSNFVDEYFSVP